MRAPTAPSGRGSSGSSCPGAASDRQLELARPRVPAPRPVSESMDYHVFDADSDWEASPRINLVTYNYNNCPDYSELSMSALPTIRIHVGPIRKESGSVVPDSRIICR